MEIKVGMSHSETVVVDATNVASAVGSGLAEVFATPRMVSLLELTARQCIQQCVGEGQTTVGAQVNISHKAATPIGMSVTATATVTAVDRRRVDFDIVVRDEVEVVGEGTHTRFIVDRKRFEQKARDKAAMSKQPE